MPEITLKLFSKLIFSRIAPVKKEYPHDTHYENMPIQIYWKFYHQKMKIFR